VRKYLNSLSTTAEFVIVITVAFGFFVVVNIVDVISPQPPTRFSDAQLVSLLAYEIGIGVPLLAFLYMRGWTVERIGLRPSLADTGVGVGLSLMGYFAFYAAYWMVALVWPEAAQAMARQQIGSQALSLPVVVAVSLINPLFEETFVCGYVIAALKKRPDPWTGINVSVGIRMLYHLYQGAAGVINVVPAGLIFGIWYARTGRLWPLLVAHALWDFLPLVAYVHG
jgi:membrane protease YdiL (CAAX protease family)